MSNALAIAAVTTTLRAILEAGVQSERLLGDTTVTTQPLDKAREGTKNQLNLFLYQTLPNAAWRNMDLPGRLMPGETGSPPLALKLNYLITAYGRDNDMTGAWSHLVLGKAMSVLHDHPLLGPDEIRAATLADLPLSDLHQQVDRVRVTLQALSLEEVSKLWTGLQTQYRLSVAYEATVVLIESTLPARTPLPVLRRGLEDRGADAQGSLIPPYPALAGVAPTTGQSSARLGEPVTLTGHHLGGTAIRVVWNHRLWQTPRETGPIGGTATDAKLDALVPDEPASWPAGFYTVSVRVQRPDESFRRATNQVSLSVAPTLTITPRTAPAGTITFSVTANPQVTPRQRAALLLGDREIPAEVPTEPPTEPTSMLTFVAPDVAPGEYLVRLRVDGVDSLLVDRSVTPPAFDSTQKVTVT